MPQSCRYPNFTEFPLKIQNLPKNSKSESATGHGGGVDYLTAEIDDVFERNAGRTAFFCKPHTTTILGQRKLTLAPTPDHKTVADERLFQSAPRTFAIVCWERRLVKL